MKLNPEEANLISIFVRKLKQGKTYEEFKENWYPDKSFEFPVRVINAVNSIDSSEILSIGLMKLDLQEIDNKLNEIKEQELIRHNRIDSVIECTKLKGIYIIKDDNDMTNIG